MSNKLERNKASARAFYDLMFHQCRPREAIEEYAGEVYIQHNLHVADGKGSVHRVLRTDGRRVPRKEDALQMNDRGRQLL